MAIVCPRLTTETVAEDYSVTRFSITALQRGFPVAAGA